MRTTVAVAPVKPKNQTKKTPAARPSGILSKTVRTGSGSRNVTLENEIPNATIVSGMVAAPRGDSTRVAMTGGSISPSAQISAIARAMNSGDRIVLNSDAVREALRELPK